MNPQTSQKIIKTILFCCLLTTLSILFFIIVYILYHGLGQVSPAFLASPIKDMGKSGGIFSSIVSTIYLSFLSVLIATPAGVATAVYLTHYTRDNIFTACVRLGTDILAGIPSIIFGLFGFIFFVIYLSLGWSILSGSLTLAAMLLPTIIRTSEEAIRAVPKSLMEVNFSLGGSRWQGISRVVIPKALPGIVTGIILSLGRAVSETAALIFTAGMSVRVPGSIFSSGRSLAVHFYTLAREGISLPNAFATAAVLIISILVINITSYVLMYHLLRKYN